MNIHKPRNFHAPKVIRMHFICILLLVCAHAADVFFVGGQSNAKEEMAHGIRDILIQSGNFEEPEIVWINHSGNSLKQWYDQGPAANYDIDFYDVDGLGQGRLEQAIEDEDDTLKALFWFQGEGDVLESEAELYERRFRAMLDRLSDDMGTGGDFGVSGARYHLAKVYLNSFDPGPIRAAQEAMVARDAAWAGATETKEYPRRDGIHLDRGDLYELGRAMANQYLVSSGFPAVPYQHYWQGPVESAWGNRLNWSTQTVPQSKLHKQLAIFDSAISPTGRIVTIEAIHSIDGMRIFGQKELRDWSFQGLGGLAVSGEIHLLDAEIIWEVPLMGNPVFRGGGGEISFRAPWIGGPFYFGADGEDSNTIRLDAPHIVDSATQAIHFGSVPAGSVSDVLVEVTRDQVSKSYTYIYSGLPKADLSARMVVKNKATWTQSGYAPLNVGMSTTSGQGASTGELVIEGGTLHLKKGSSLVVGFRGGVGRLRVLRGSVIIDKDDYNPIVVGDVTIRHDLDAGKAGIGSIFLEEGSVIVTARGFLARKANVGASGTFSGVGDFNFNGGVLRVTDDIYNLFGSESQSAVPVSVNLLNKGGVIDTNGCEVNIMHSIGGTGDLVKRGEGVLRLFGDNELTGNLSVERGSLYLDRPLYLESTSVLNIYDAELDVFDLENRGTIRLYGDAKLNIRGRLINQGIIDTQEWAGNLPDGIGGVIIDRKNLKVDRIWVESNLVKLQIFCHEGHFYQLQKLSLSSQAWENIGEVIPGANAEKIFEVARAESRGLYRIALKGTL